MQRVNIAELKDNLSRYLNTVREGGEIIICDRNKAIAKIVPIASGEDPESERLALAAEGKLRLGEGPVEDDFFHLPAPKVSTKVLRKVMAEERDER